MKKEIQAELVSLAHKILRAGDTAPVSHLKNQAKELYEKLTLLEYTENYFSEAQPTIGKVYEALAIEEVTKTKKEEVTRGKEPIFEEKNIVEKEPVETKKVIPVIEEIAEEVPEVVFEKKIEEIPEIVIDHINEKVIQKDIFIPRDEALEQEKEKHEIPVFEKQKVEVNEFTDELLFESVNDTQVKGVSLNDRLKKTITIGLNDRLAFIKHLFSGDTTRYNETISRLDSIYSLSEAESYIKGIKNKRNAWEGKEEYEERFMKIIANKFD